MLKLQALMTPGVDRLTACGEAALLCVMLAVLGFCAAAAPDLEAPDMAGEPALLAADATTDSHAAHDVCVVPATTASPAPLFAGGCGYARRVPASAIMCPRILVAGPRGPPLV